MTKKIQRDNKPLQLIIVLALVITLVASGVLWISRLLDARKFADINRDKDAVVADLISYLGNQVLASKPKNVCFNTEQGPYDNGRLWCQVATVISLRNDVNFADTGQHFVSIAQSKGFHATAETSNNETTYSFDIANHRWCEFGYTTSSGNGAYVGTYNVLAGESAPALAVACADRAKAKHYLYVD